MTRNAGFSLLETVAAFAIFSLAASTFYSLYFSSAERVFKDARRQQAVLLAESLLDETLALPYSDTARRGTFEQYEWLVSTAPAEDAPGDGQTWALARAEVQVSWHSGPAKEQVRLHGLRIVRHD